MNRDQRRFQEKSVKKVHQTQSFEDLVGERNQRALQPYIDQKVSEAKSEIARMMLEELGTVQTRLTVLEKIAIENGETKETISERILNEEDLAFGVAKSAGPVQKGDMLRLNMFIKLDGMKNYAKVGNVVINAVATPPNPEVPYQTNKEIEEGLIGAMPGETREIAVKLQEKDGTYKITVDRISTPIPRLGQPQAPVAPAPETPVAADGATQEGVTP